MNLLDMDLVVSRVRGVTSVTQSSIVLSREHCPRPRYHSRLEPSGLSCSDGKRPDGITIAPWKEGRSLVWDATCPDTFASSYEALAVSETGAVAVAAEKRKHDYISA